MDSDIMTNREVTEYLKLTEKTGYRHAADGRIPGFKVGRVWRFRRGEIDWWIEWQTAGHKERGGKWCEGRMPTFVRPPPWESWYGTSSGP